MLVGIQGRAQSGKNTLSTYLIDAFKKKHELYFIELAFAGLLKNICAEYFSLSHDQLYGDKKEVSDNRYEKDSSNVMQSGVDYGDGRGLPPWYWTPREIMQEVGSFFRKIDRNFWVNELDRYIRTSSLDNVIITDVRHENECEYVKNNGVLIKIVRPQLIKIHGMSHESETAMDGKSDDYFDIIVNNDGTLKDLEKAAENLADALIKLNKLKQQGGLV